MDRYVVVVGGANVDIKGRLLHEGERATSNPGVVWRSSGGVGRNIAENLAVLGCPVRLIAPVGEDSEGAFLTEQLQRIGVDIRFMIRRTEYRTGTYLAVLNRRGELELAVSDMAAIDNLAPEHVFGQKQAFVGAAVVCLDANLSAAALAAAIDLADAAGAVTVADPVSAPKSRHLLAVLKRLTLVTPSRSELAAMTGMPVGTQADVEAAVRDLHSRGVQRVAATLGDEGVCYLTADGTVAFARANAAHVVDVNGAGDAFTAGMIDALRQDLPMAEAVARAQELAAQIVASEDSVLRGDRQ